jgi:hypothetical protein
MSAPIQPRRSTRLASAALAKAEAAAFVAAEPVVAAPARPSRKIKAITREEQYEHLVATDPQWAAYDVKRNAGKALRDAYKAGAWATAPTPQLLAMHEVVEGVAALKAKIAAAKTIEDFQACAEIADRELYEKAESFEWRDSMAMFFLTDCRSYVNEAVAWLKWAAANPAQAMAFVSAVRREKAGDYSGPPSYKLGPSHLCSSSPIEAKKWAINALTYFEEGMF